MALCHPASPQLPAAGLVPLGPRTETHVVSSRSPCSFPSEPFLLRAPLPPQLAVHQAHVSPRALSLLPPSSAPTSSKATELKLRPCPGLQSSGAAHYPSSPPSSLVYALPAAQSSWPWSCSLLLPCRLTSSQLLPQSPPCPRPSSWTLTGAQSPLSISLLPLPMRSPVLPAQAPALLVQGTLLYLLQGKLPIFLPFHLPTAHLHSSASFPRAPGADSCPVLPFNLPPAHQHSSERLFWGSRDSSLSSHLPPAHLHGYTSSL